MSVKAISNASGGRMPVPAASADPRPRSRALAGQLGLTSQATATFGFHDTTVSSANAGLAENVEGLAARLSRMMCSARKPACTLTRSTPFQRPSAKVPMTRRSMGTSIGPAVMNVLRARSVSHSTPPDTLMPASSTASVCTRPWTRRLSDADGLSGSNMLRNDEIEIGDVELEALADAARGTEPRLDDARAEGVALGFAA